MSGAGLTLILLLLALTGCGLTRAITPDGTTLRIMSETTYHTSRPGVLLESTPQQYNAPERIALRALAKTDGEICSKSTPSSPADRASVDTRPITWKNLMGEIQTMAQAHWDCMWALGWRWKTTAPPSP